MCTGKKGWGLRQGAKCDVNKFAFANDREQKASAVTTPHVVVLTFAISED